MTEFRVAMFEFRFVKFQDEITVERQDCVANPNTDVPTSFFIQTDFDLTLVTLTDVGRRWSAIETQDGGQKKLQVEITFELQVMALRVYNGYPHIFDHARRQYITAYIARRCPDIEIQNGGHQAGSGNVERRDSESIPTLHLHLQPCQTQYMGMELSTEIQDGGHRNQKWK